MSLPYNLLEIFRKQSGTLIPVNTLRVLNNVDGTPGEGWLASWSEGLIFISRNPDSGIQKHRFPQHSIRSITLDTDTPTAPGLIMDTDDGQWVLPFLAMDISRAKRLAEQFAAVQAESPPPLPEPPPLPGAPLKTYAREMETKFRLQVVYFCAAMLAAANASGRPPAKSQLAQIHHIFEDPECISQANRLNKHLDIDKLFRDINEIFSHEQKNCLLANIYDLMIMDGDFTRKEQAFLNKFLSTVHCDTEFWEQCKNTIMIKNNYQVFAY